MNIYKQLVFSIMFVGMLTGAIAPSMQAVIHSADILQAQDELAALSRAIHARMTASLERVQNPGYVCVLMYEPGVPAALMLLPEEGKAQLIQYVTALDTSLCSTATDRKNQVLKAYSEFNEYLNACLPNLGARAQFVMQQTKQGLVINDATELNNKFTLGIQPLAKAAPYSRNKPGSPARQQRNTGSDQEPGFLDLISEKGLFGGSFEWVKDNPVKALLFGLTLAGTIYGVTAKLKGLWPFDEKKQAENK